MKKHVGKLRQTGFTIVELLIVIVVIGILAAVVIVAYNGIQQQAREAKIQSDFGQLKKAAAIIHANGNTLIDVTDDGWSGGACIAKPDGTDIAALDRSDACWVDYLDTLDRLSDASNMNLRTLVDPWGRPYYIDENEGEGGACDMDTLGVFTVPFVSYDGTNWTNIPTLCTP